MLSTSLKCSSRFSGGWVLRFALIANTTMWNARI